MESVTAAVLVIVGAIITAATPLLMELGKLVLAWCRNPHPATRQSLGFQEAMGGPSTDREGAWAQMDLGTHSIVLSWETDDVDPWCLFWLIRAGDAEHYKVICDGHCLWSELPLVASSLMTVMEAAIRSIDGAPVAGVR
jgi:hypothetical protein